MYRKFFSVTLATVILFAASVHGQAAEKSALDQARDALVAKDPDGAIKLVDPIIARADASDTKDADAICPGTAVALLGAFMARQDPTFVISTENDWCEAMLLKGYALAELGKSEQASELLGKLVRFDPNNPNYLAEYAFVLQSTRKLDESMAFYKRVVNVSEKLSDKSAQRHWRAVGLRGIGFIHSDRQEWDDAVKAYKASLKEEPDNKIALGELLYIEQSRSK